MNKAGTAHADARRFLDDRGYAGPLAPNGLNPANIMEKPVRERIVDSYFWKEQCFAMNEADMVDRVVEHVRFIGGTFGASQKPSPFLCLAFKLLQLAPTSDVLEAYLHYGGERFKYLRALAAFYVRLTRKSEDVYKLLEPFLEDRRKLRRKARAATTLTFMDEFVDELLTKERVCATSLWRLADREVLEDQDKLEPRVSALGDLEDILNEEDGEAGEAGEANVGEGRDGDAEDEDEDEGEGEGEGEGGRRHEDDAEGSGDGERMEDEDMDDRDRRRRSRLP